MSSLRRDNAEVLEECWMISKASPALERFVEDEFPSRSEEWFHPVNRREVLRLMCASFS